MKQDLFIDLRWEDKSQTTTTRAMTSSLLEPYYMPDTHTQHFTLSH